MIHDALVGVKRKCTRGWRSSQRLTSGVECVLEFSAAEECAALQSDRLLADIQLLAAEVRLLCGDWDEAAPQIEGGIEHGNLITLPQFQAHLALVAAACGDDAAAARALAPY